MKEELKAAFVNRSFLLAFAVILLCLMGFSLPTFISSLDWGEFAPSALHLSIGGIFFGGVMLLLPFCASVPYATSQVDEIRTAFMQWKVLRGSIPRYSLSKILATAASGASAVALAFLVNAVIWNLLGAPIDPVANTSHELVFADGCMYNEWYKIAHGLPMYLSMALGIFVSSAVWATVGLAVAVWVPDRLLCITIPACLYYLWSAGLFRFLFGWYLPPPSALFNDALTWQIVRQSLGIYALLFMLAVGVYIAGLKRRVQHA